MHYSSHGCFYLTHSVHTYVSFSLLAGIHLIGWRFGLVVTRCMVSINVVRPTLRWARLVPGWVAVFGRVNYPVM